MALGATARHCTFFIPVAECFFRAGKVTGIDAVQGRHVNRLGERGVQVLDRVVQQLDDVLATVGIGAGVLDGGLIVVGSLQQARCPGIKRCLRLSSISAVGIGVEEEVRVRSGVVQRWPCLPLRWRRPEWTGAGLLQTGQFSSRCLLRCRRCRCSRLRSRPCGRSSDLQRW